MPQINLPRVRLIGKRKARSQMCEIFTDDGRIVDQELDVIKSCVDDPNLGMGFLLDADDQFQGADKQWYQILYEKSMIPVSMIGGIVAQQKDLPKLLDQIYDESQEAAKEHQYNLAMKNTWAERITLIVAILCGSAVIMFAIQHFGSRSGN